MRTSHIKLLGIFSLYFITLYFAFTNPTQETRPEYPTYVNGPTTITGYLMLRTFPGRQYISEEAAYGEPLFANGEYLAVANNFTETATPFFLFNRVLNGTIWETPQVWPLKGYELGGLTHWEVYGAYTSQCRVTIRGNAFTVNRLNRTYQCIDPNLFVVLDRTHLPLFVEGWSIDKYGFYPGGLYSFGIFDRIFAYVSRSDYFNSTIFYRVTLSEGDSVSFTADSSRAHIWGGGNARATIIMQSGKYCANK